MELIQTVPSIEHEFVDKPQDVTKDYYYGVTAVDKSGSSSKISKVYPGKFYDYSTPLEPKWERTEWVKLDHNGIEHPWSSILDDLLPVVALTISTHQSGIMAVMQCLKLNEYKSVCSWIAQPEFDENQNVWLYTTYDSKAVLTEEQVYRAKLMSKAGVELISTQEKHVLIPS
jgi:hypothetical protein